MSGIVIQIWHRRIALNTIVAHGPFTARSWCNTVNYIQNLRSGRDLTMSTQWPLQVAVVILAQHIMFMNISFEITFPLNAITRANVDPALSSHMASLRHSELIKTAITL